MPVATIGETATHAVSITEETIEAFAALSGDIVYLSQDLSFEDPIFPGETVEATARGRRSI